MEFRAAQQSAYDLAGETQKVPAQRMIDFTKA
jgi:uncharacterized FAD-dependent dehydrogenase